jgi:hypothetical protein
MRAVSNFAGPAQQRFDVLPAISRAERLGQVVVSAQFQTYNAIHFSFKVRASG